MIKFKTKVIDIENGSTGKVRKAINVPVFTRSHCDMRFFRSHKRYGGFANSDLFPSVLERIRRMNLPNKYNNLLYLDEASDAWTINTSGFLAVVSLTVE